MYETAVRTFGMEEDNGDYKETEWQKTELKRKIGEKL